MSEIYTRIVDVIELLEQKTEESLHLAETAKETNAMTFWTAKAHAFNEATKDVKEACLPRSVIREILTKPHLRMVGK